LTLGFQYAAILLSSKPPANTFERIWFTASTPDVEGGIPILMCTWRSVQPALPALYPCLRQCKHQPPATDLHPIAIDSNFLALKHTTNRPRTFARPIDRLSCKSKLQLVSRVQDSERKQLVFVQLLQVVFKVLASISCGDGARNNKCGNYSQDRIL